jgi:hypothetical protein
MAEPELNTKYDVVDAWDRAQHLLVPRFMFPVLAALFVLLCGAMSVFLFAVGKIFGGLLFASVVLVGLYVAYNNIRKPR